MQTFKVEKKWLGHPPKNLKNYKAVNSETLLKVEVPWSSQQNKENHLRTGNDILF